jgi:hypothetical protein
MPSVVATHFRHLDNNNVLQKSTDHTHIRRDKWENK